MINEINASLAEDSDSMWIGAENPQKLSCDDATCGGGLFQWFDATELEYDPAYVSAGLTSASNNLGCVYVASDGQLVARHCASAEGLHESLCQVN